jgi:leucyl/phenylalanyl-tRNA--protein transferase
MPPNHFQDWDSFKFSVSHSVASDGVVAFCADLSAASVLGAYRQGMFPLPAPDDYHRRLYVVRYEQLVAAGAIAIVGDQRSDPYRVGWWSPDPRPIIGAEGVHLGRNVRRRLRHDGIRTTANADFRRVANACRAGREPRWLTDELLCSLAELHEQGWAHSIEVWLEGNLVGGAIGIGIGGVISGDSLFGLHQGAAAIAVADMRARLIAAGGTVIDAQWDSPFLRSLGAVPIARERYLELLDRPAEPILLPTDSLPAHRLLPPWGPDSNCRNSNELEDIPITCTTPGIAKSLENDAGPTP